MRLRTHFTCEHSKVTIGHVRLVSPHSGPDATVHTTMGEATLNSHGLWIATRSSGGMAPYIAIAEKFEISSAKLRKLAQVYGLYDAKYWRYQ